ncbi:MAG TPA: tRNA-(ms[2]io[6]A)-hydroxylase [Woeseiaceae bacterium]|nr:tRNA-(ms[2]io[6]A)-hydroxylase [Woeseiaceae bacterium]
MAALSPGDPRPPPAAAAPSVPEAIRRFLGAATPSAWVDAAAVQPGLILVDHANCELKAASTAMNLIYRYPERTDLGWQMSRLAREELRHYEQVQRLMQALGVVPRPLSASRYAAGLRGAARRREPGRLTDLLLIGALIEARSCERFALLAPRLARPMAGLYAGLLASEARHFENYLALAGAGEEDDALEARLAELRAVENDLATSPDTELRFHSGPPTADT